MTDPGELDVTTLTVNLSDLRSRLSRVDAFAAGLAAIVAAQAVWFAILMHAGWYYQADFDNLASATGRSLDWSYLSMSQGGHLDVAGRAVLWLLNRTIPLNYNATIGLRLIASAGATYLLGRLLRELVGPRRGVLALVALFALSPCLSELLVLAALRAHVRYTVTGRLRWAAGTGVAMLGATLVAEQAAVSALALPVLTFAFLSEGTVRDRLRAVLRSWPAWVMIAAPILGFAAYYFASGKYATKSTGFGVSTAVHLVGAFWFDGGPVAWSTAGGNYFAFAAAPLALRWLDVGLLVLAVGWTVRRTSVRALCGWAIPLLVSGIGMLFVGRARYELFGEATVARHFEYAAYAAVPAAVGVALAIWTTSVSDIQERLAGGVAAPPSESKGAQHRRLRFGRWSGRIAVLALAVISAISAGTYASHWSQSPSKAYVDRLATSVSRAGSTATVFDTNVATDVIPSIQKHRTVGDLLGLMGLDPYLNNGPTQPEVVDETGRLVPAQFLPTATVPIKGTNTFCNDLLTEQTVQAQPLDSTPHLNAWFLRLTYFEAVPTVLDVHVLTSAGQTVAPVGGSRVTLQRGAGSVYLLLPSSQPTAVLLQGVAPTTNVCLTNISVGYPFPAK
jgi:hypothetical protein